MATPTVATVTAPAVVVRAAVVETVLVARAAVVSSVTVVEASLLAVVAMWLPKAVAKLRLLKFFLLPASSFPDHSSGVCITPIFDPPLIFHFLLSL